MITFVSWLWGRGRYDFRAVNALRAGVARHYARPHRFLCVTNTRAGIDPEVEIVPDREDFAELPSPWGANFPSCYRRLRAFAPDAGETFGERFVSVDLDAVVVGDLVPLVDRPEDFVIWRDPGNRTPYCGSLWLLRAGARPSVWTDFDPKRSPREAKAAGRLGSDQAWIAHALGPFEPTWTAADGVLSYRMDGLRRNFLPANARIVFFHGKIKPGDAEPQRLAWVKENYA